GGAGGAGAQKQGNDGAVDQSALNGSTGRIMIIDGSSLSPANATAIVAASAGTLKGGPGNIILIGGTTDDDTNQAWREANLQAWNQAADFWTELLALTNDLPGSGHGHTNGGANQLRGGPGLDLFFASRTAEVLDLAEEMIAQIEGL